MMLTKAGDFSIHQTPELIAVAGTDRNFCDRHFFNGQANDGASMLVWRWAFTHISTSPTLPSA
jgi:hypothetical protein